MYFCNNKICKNENEQIELLEMRHHACFCFRNGKDDDGIIKSKQSYKKGCGY